MREVDRIMVEEYGVLLVQMMENAGRALAGLARHRFLDGDARGRSVLVLAGPGGNGGGGLACARRLHGWGARARVVLSRPASSLAEVTRLQLTILERMGVSIAEGGGLPRADLVVDALIGYSLHGPPTGTSAALIRAANRHGAPVLALDVPSGIDSTTGEVYEPAVRATATLTLALPKCGLDSEQARQHVGELYLADIGVPPELYARPGLDLEVGHLFAGGDVVRVR